MPSKTPRQQAFFGAELGRKRAGKATRTKLTAKQLEDFARLKKKRKAGK